MSGSRVKNRMAQCHPNRKHYAKGMCQDCYDGRRSAAQPKKADQPGLVRIHVKGWGCVA